jgi:hypothetical protein
MNKDQYFNQHRFQQLEQQELERKWRVFNEQQMFMNMSLSNTVSSNSGGVGNLIESISNNYVNDDYINNYFE